MRSVSTYLVARWPSWLLAAGLILAALIVGWLWGWA